MNSNIKIINATWEKRNLEKDVSEIIVDKNAELNDLKNCISKLNSDLVYCKVHNLNLNAIKFLEEEGFKYCENIFSLKKRLRFFQIHDVFKNALSQLYSTPIKKNDLELILSEFDKGIFETDRISLDPEFGYKISNKRYKNWVKDMYNSNGEYQIKIVKNKDHKPIGFYTNKYINKIAYAPLGGMFSNYRMSGLGHSIIYFPLIDALNNNCKVVKTQISSNNLPVFNIYSSVFGFEITENHVVLKKFI
jgi:hypothetical protein